MLKNSEKAKKKRDKAKTAFNRVFKAISEASLKGTSCPNEPLEKNSAIKAYQVLMDCNTTAYDLCNEAVLSTEDIDLANTCKNHMSDSINDFEVNLFHYQVYICVLK